MQVEHLYYKHESISMAVQRSHLFNQTWGRYSDLHPASTSKMMNIDRSKRNQSLVHPGSFLGYPTVDPPVSHHGTCVEELCKYIFKHGDERGKSRALLCSVFHHALHDRFYRARDLFLISHIQDSIDKADPSTQILYNRALATLGLSAFRQGLVQKAHDCLAGICSGRVRELLAQGVTNNRFYPYEQDVEQQRIEARRQVPYHMQINTELLDCCHLTCAMLLELPFMARGNQTPSNVISRQFRKKLKIYNMQPFTGPPENTSDHVLAAAKALVVGEWKRACDYILNLELWNLIPNGGGEKVKVMLSERIREEAVRTYLFTYGSTAYNSLSLSHLCQTFEMDAVSIRRIVSKMIFQKEIAAAWEHPADTLVLHSTDPSPLQTLSLQVAEKVAQLVDSNERLLDPLTDGKYGHHEDWKDGNRRQQWGGKEGGQRDFSPRDRGDRDDRRGDRDDRRGGGRGTGRGGPMPNGGRGRGQGRGGDRNGGGRGQPQQGSDRNYRGSGGGGVGAGGGGGDAPKSSSGPNPSLPLRRTWGTKA